MECAENTFEIHYGAKTPCTPVPESSVEFASSGGQRSVMTDRSRRWKERGVATGGGLIPDPPPPPQPTVLEPTAEAEFEARAYAPASHRSPFCPVPM